ncbi:protein of unknown function [Sporobacter termitidis DSM 10068]|uniref:DUF5067 domain-containing protein n=1 Tax=Sporobacter termitidis DSM 10068 TaxID=1123282 RepID=A0A1M5XXA9_9FIRM|nr:DUF5067 domain-containing protein [Sporobacter termitidis]SHI04362.1 protein of unknown function [Sporobacter termitidis DSM 10068]
MKKVRYILIAVFTLALLASCSKTDSITGPGSGTVGNYIVKIDSYELTKDAYGKDAVIINYEWGNNGKKAGFFYVISAKVYQNGAECKSAIITDDTIYHGSDALKSIKRGEIQKVQLAYVLQDTKTPLDVEVTEAANTNADAPKVTQTFDIA